MKDTEPSANDYNRSDTSEDFKAKTKRWVIKNCPSRLCKSYILHLEFD